MWRPAGARLAARPSVDHTRVMPDAGALGHGRPPELAAATVVPATGHQGVGRNRSAPPPPGMVAAARGVAGSSAKVAALRELTGGG